VAVVIYVFCEAFGYDEEYYQTKNDSTAIEEEVILIVLPPVSFVYIEQGYHDENRKRILFMVVLKERVIRADRCDH
jgi:hypothetical protein